MRPFLIAAALLYAGLLLIAPLVALAWSAFAEGAGPLVRALLAPDVLAAFANTVFIAAIVVALHAVFGMALAWVLVRHTRLRGRRVLDRLVDLPFVVSPVVAGYSIILLFGRDGLLAPAADAIGVQVAFAFPGMVLATLFVTLPIVVRELKPAIEAFGREEEQAAASLGARDRQTFRLVTFPALRTAFLYGLTLTGARAIGEFGAILVVGAGVQGRTETATLYVDRAIHDRHEAGAYGAALALGLISLAAVLGIELYRARRERAGRTELGEHAAEAR